MNNKGFTLVELIATILVLALLMSIGTYTIINTLNSTKKQNIESLKTQIKSAAENYVMECAYSRESIVEMLGTQAKADTFCARGENGKLALSHLVDYGYLTGNAKIEDTNKYTLVNPNTNTSIAGCTIKVKYDDKGQFKVCGKSDTSKCIKIFEYDAEC